MKQELAFLDTVEDPRLWMERVRTLAEVFLELHDPESAADLFDHAARCYARTGDDALRAAALVELANVLFMLEDSAGVAALEEAGEIYERLGDDVSARLVAEKLESLPEDIGVRAMRSSMPPCLSQSER